MTFLFWLRGPTRGPATTLKKSRPSAPRARSTRHRPCVERLEDRTLLSLDFGMAFNLADSGIVEIGKAIAVDGDGNVYVQGSFTGTIDADPGPGEALLTSAGGNDYFVSKYGASGGLLWAVRMGGAESDSNFGDDIGVDGSGNVYVTGRFRGTADFGSFTLTSQGQTDAFVAKLDTGGSVMWAVRLGTGNDVSGGLDETSAGLAVDSSGSVYTTGWFYRETIFVAKHDTNGNLLWLRQMGQPTSGGGYAYDIALDGSGNAYITGKFSGQVDFNPGSGTFALTSTKVRGLADNWDAFAVSLDNGGNFRWAFNVTGDKNDEGRGIAVDGSGNIYLAGNFASTANDFDPGKSKTTLSNAGGFSDIFVAKYSSSRSLIWARSMGGAGEDTCNAMAVDGSGQVYTTGHYYETADFNPGSESSTLTSAGSRDVFVSQLSSTGDYIWAGQMGGAFQESANDLALDGGGNVYLTGYFKGQADFDPGAGEYVLSSTLDGIGSATVDAFVAKLKPTSTLLTGRDSGTVESADWLSAIDFVLSEEASTKRKR
jgi:hypothetical protein